METAEAEVKGHSHGELIAKDDLTTFQEVGSRNALNVNIVAQAGEDYTHKSTNSVRFGRSVHKDKVPEGKIYVQISSDRKDISDSWKDLREVQAKQQSSSSS